MTWRPERLVAVAGTGTAVGKTWVTAALARRMAAAGRRVAVRKPAQSFGAGETTDAEVLASATGEDPAQVCPPHRWYALAMAPPMAAAALGLPPFAVADLVAEIRWPAGCEIGLVETAGGPRSPLASDGDSAALVAALDPDRVVLVSEPGLGAINAVRLSAAALAANRSIVHLNRFDPADGLHRANRAWLEGDGLEVTTDVDTLAAHLAEGR